jgi:hypothetical protein
MTVSQVALTFVVKKRMGKCSGGLQTSKGWGMGKEWKTKVSPVVSGLAHGLP